MRLRHQLIDSHDWGNSIGIVYDLSPPLGALPT